MPHHMTDKETLAYNKLYVFFGNAQHPVVSGIENCQPMKH